MVSGFADCQGRPNLKDTLVVNRDLVKRIESDSQRYSTKALLEMLQKVIDGYEFSGRTMNTQLVMEKSAL